jgi:hypothetical protein
MKEAIPPLPLHASVERTEQLYLLPLCIFDFPHSFLDALTKLQKATISFVMSVGLYVRMEQLCSHWRNFHEI